MRVLTASLCLFTCANACTGFASERPLYQTGVARIDITPAYPIRLSGYAVRKTEATNAVQRLWAKALAIGSDTESPAILIAVDNTGVPKHVRDEVVARLAKRRIDPTRVAICSSHSHAAPYLSGYLPTLFGEPLPPEHQERVDRYTKELTDAIEQVALEALKNRRPGLLNWGQTKAGFAANRRTKGGPVDHDLPMLAVTDPKGKLRALLVNYACHCTTLGGDFNQLCGDWAGYAQEYLERDHPGATVLVAIGCGADANPTRHAGLESAKNNGAEIATNINQLLTRTLRPIRGRLECRSREIELALDTLPTRAEWEARAKDSGYTGFHARHNLGKLDHEGALPTRIPYLIQTWNFGEDLAWLFLPGEVVVDYALRFKKELDATRLWVNAYANDVPCYVPSERILREGGYEGGGAMTFYGWPARIAPGVEQQIVTSVRELLPAGFTVDEKLAESPPPKAPEESLAAFETKSDLEVQLVASEPLIVSPVAIDWGADGRLWVVEMYDYPTGLDGNWKPGGRVKVLEDTDRDGKYDRANVVLDGIPFPTGVTAWRDGALVCTAPDILYAELTAQKRPPNSQRSSDVAVKKIFSGFITDNYQARVNSLSLGLDNWIYGANGLLGGTIHGVSSGRDVDIRGRDFRMNPDTGAFEPASGLSQQGRARDDWGNWFGCDNSMLFWHYPIPDHYVRRNPHVTAPTPRVAAARGEANVLHPISRTLERFNQPESVNRTTSACGLGVYRDVLLGEQYSQNLFVCEAVHNLVRRGVPKADGVTFIAEPSPDERQSEFLASRDNWCRPVQARTGPDGALYIVDMYRFVIEHPRWIPPERLAKLDVRAGADKGRIYRVVPAGKKLREVQNLRTLATPKLVAALDTPNGTTRDLAHLELVQRSDRAAIRPLEALALQSQWPAARLQALCVLEGMGALTPRGLVSHLADSHPAVRANAIRLSEPFLGGPGADGGHIGAVLKLAEDPELIVRYQLALSLGESSDPRAGAALGQLAQRDIANAWMRAAVLSSATRQPAEILQAVLAGPQDRAGSAELMSQLLATVAGTSDPAALRKVLTVIVLAGNEQYEEWQLRAFCSLLDATERKRLALASIFNEAGGETQQRLNRLFDSVETLAANTNAAESIREAAIDLLGRREETHDVDLVTLAALLESPASARLQSAALERLKRQRSPKVAALVLAGWMQRSPGRRAQLIDLLLRRDEWTRELLSATEGGTVTASEVSPANRQRLTSHKESDIQQRARALFAAPGSRAEVVKSFQETLKLSGNANRGSDWFAKACATCHALRGQGHDVGPSLTALTGKTPADFLVAILDPNAVVEPRFVAYNIETKDGRSLSGIVSAETATTLTVIQGGGVEEKILRSEIEEMRASRLSLMPEGLEQGMSPQDLADLIAYLRTAPAPFGSASSEKAAVARKAFLSDGENGIANILTSAGQLPYPSWMGELPMPYCRQSDGRSRLTWETLPVPAELKPHSSHRFRLPAGMGYFSQPSGKFELRLNGSRVLDFDVTLTDRTWQSADDQVRMSYTVQENNTEDSNGVLLLDIAGALLQPGKPATFEIIGSAANSQRWFGIYLVSNQKPVATKPLSLVDQILSDSTPTKERELIIQAHPELSEKFIEEMTKGLAAGQEAEEYRRIPWIWRVALGAGKRNDARELLKMLEVTLPGSNEPLRDWQAVVLGGGIINGLSQVGIWPGERMTEVLNGRDDLNSRWHRANELASAMADDESVKAGTRYDALRMVAMEGWDKSGAQLLNYLSKGVNAELQQGAISGLADVKSQRVAQALVSGLGHYSKQNRELALEALVRDESRLVALQAALSEGRVRPEELGEARLQKLGRIQKSGPR